MIGIRELQREDLEAVLGVAASLGAWFQPLDQMALAMDLYAHEGLVARQGDALVGFLTYRLLDEQRAELSWLGTAPARQGHGIGSALLRAMEARLREQGVRAVQLSTVPADFAAAFAPTNAFYFRHGFRVQQRDEDFYAHGRPRLLLVKELPP